MSGKSSVGTYEEFFARVQAGEGLIPDANDAAYEHDYRAMRSWFDSQKLWTGDLVRVGSLMVYGWMPTILRSGKTIDFNRVAGQINSNEISQECWNFANGSYVGSSKFLHFLKPAEFAIWDSRVSKALGWKGPANSRAKFERYQDWSRRLMKESGSPDLRYSEQCLFWLGKTF